MPNGVIHGGTKDTKQSLLIRQFSVSSVPPRFSCCSVERLVQGTVGVAARDAISASISAASRGTPVLSRSRPRFVMM